MPESRTALQPVTGNLPTTPGRQVKHLTSELGKMETENNVLKSSITDLTKALENIRIVKEKVEAPDNRFNKMISAEEVKGKKKDKDAPAPAVTAYRYWHDDIKTKMDTDEKSGIEMRQMWKECQGSDRTKYMELALVDKKRFDKENVVYQQQVSEKETEDKALQSYYEKKKQELAMEFYEAHLKAQSMVNEKPKKKVRDQDAPKRPMSNYMYFAQEKRDKIVKKHPKKSLPEISKIMGEEWGKLFKGESGKKGTKKYDDLAVIDRMRYEKEKETYDAVKATRVLTEEQECQAQLEEDKEEAMKLMKEAEEHRLAEIAIAAEVDSTDVEAGPKTQKAKKTKPSGPKRPSSAYIFFTVHNRAQIKSGMAENVTNQELMVEIGRQWKCLEEKKTYNEMSSKDKERYEKEVEALKNATVEMS